MDDLLLRHARVLDPATGTYDETDLRIADGEVVETGSGLGGADVRTLDLRGAFVLPGLVDCHAHVVAASADLSAAAHLVALVPGVPHRGEHGGDARPRASPRCATSAVPTTASRGRRRRAWCGVRGSTSAAGRSARPAGTATTATPTTTTAGPPASAAIADGVDAVRAAARDELRKGAHHLKVMASGGVASPTDRIDSTQYSVDELVAVVQEAEAANRYVAAHAYTVRAVERALRAGVRSIEHANLIDDYGRPAVPRARGRSW